MKQVDDLLKQLGVLQYGGSFVDKSKDDFDERFVCVSSGGIHEEGRADFLYADSEEVAITAYLEQLQKWLAGRTRVIWRVQPQLNSEHVRRLCKPERLKWTVYSRLTAYTPEQFSEIKS